MRADTALPPRKPATWRDDAFSRSVASGLLALFSTTGLLLGVTWLLWKLAWALVALSGLFAQTGAHAGLAAALVVVVAAATPVAVTALLVVAGRVRRV